MLAHSSRRFALALLSPLLTILACVVVPVRVPDQKRDVSGKPLELDLAFLKSGSTTRTDVTKNLAAVDSGVNRSNFFWGRWDSSKWRSTAVGFVPPEGERIWRADNLLVQFDESGVVKKWVVVDDKGLDHQLDLFDVAADNSPLDFSPPVRASVDVPHADDVNAEIVMSSDTFEENRISPTGHHFSLRTPRSNVSKIAITPEASYYGPVSGYTPYTRPDILLVTMYLAKPGVVDSGNKSHGVGKKLWMGVEPQTFLLLRRYVKQTPRQN